MQRPPTRLGNATPALYFLVAMLCACGSISTHGQGRVAVYRCDVIVDDTLGTPVPTRGGPMPRGEIGSGVECLVWGF